MFKCKKCGNELTGNETTCPECGEIIDFSALENSLAKSMEKKKLNKIVWSIAGATAIIVIAAIAILFLVILPSETEPQLSTPIGDFTYTQHYSNTFGQVTASSGYILLIITFTPEKDIKIDDSSREEFSMGDIKAILEGEKYSASIVQESFIEGKPSTYTLVYGVPRSMEGYIAEIELP